jgi:hypothetical protein
MFWPVYYVMIFGIVGAIIRRFTVRRATLLLLAGVFLQAIDMSDRYRLARQIREVRYESALRSEFWQIAPRYYEHLTLIPTNLCPATVAPVDYREFALAAGRAGSTINAGLTARPATEMIQRYCSEFSLQFANGAFSEDDLYVVQPEVIPRVLRNASVPMACAMIDSHGVCFVRSTQARWQHAFRIVQ